MDGVVELMSAGAQDHPNARSARVEALFSSAYPDLLRFAYLVSGDRTVAEDLVQDAFVRVWRAGGRIESADAGAYARRAIVNLSRSRFRRSLVERRRLPALVDRSVQGAHDPGDRDEMWAAVLTLSPRERSCVALRFYEDLTEVQTAAALGISVGAVKKMMDRAMKKLRASLTDRSES